MAYLSPEQSPEKRSERMDLAEEQYIEAHRLAGENGFTLRGCTRVHYQLWPNGREWILNIYPSNRRLYHDPNKCGPFLHLPADWTLLDVVRAVIEQRVKGGG